MSAGPAEVAKWIASELPLTAPPSSITSTILTIGNAEGWFSSPQDGDEKAERWKDRTFNRLARELRDARAEAHPTRFDFNSSSPDHVQGYCFVAPSDPQEIQTSKALRALQDHYRDAILQTSPDDFEALSRGVLQLLGCPDPVLTPQSGDQGIDVFGELPMKGRLGFDYLLGGPDQLLSTWILGQAKRYNGTVSSAEIREFIGSTELLKLRISTDGGAALSGYAAKPFQATHKVFLTTGVLASGARTIARQSGVIVFDLNRLSALLADRSVGTTAGAFIASQLENWLSSHRR